MPSLTRRTAADRGEGRSRSDPAGFLWGRLQPRHLFEDDEDAERRSTRQSDVNTERDGDEAGELVMHVRDGPANLAISTSGAPDKEVGLTSARLLSL